MAEHGLGAADRVLGHRLRRHRLRRRRGRVGRGVPRAVYASYTRLAHLTTSTSPAGTPGSGTPAGWPSPTCARPASLGRRAARASAPAGDDELGLLRPAARPGAPPAHPRPAWAGSSTPWPRSPASATVRSTTPRPPWSSRPWRGPPTCRGYAFGVTDDDDGTRGVARRAGDRGGRGRRPRGRGSTAGGSPLPPRRRRPRGRARRAPGGRHRPHHGDAQRRRLPQRVPHVACDQALADAASRCSPPTGAAQRRRHRPRPGRGPGARDTSTPHRRLTCRRNRSQHVPSGPRRGHGDLREGRHPGRAGRLRRRDQGGVPGLRARHPGRRLHDRPRRLRPAAARRAVGPGDARAVPPDGRARRRVRRPVGTGGRAGRSAPTRPRHRRGGLS